MKFLEEKIARVLMVLSVIIVAFFVFSVVGSILWRGLPALSWDMITKVPTGGFYIGGEGGFLNAILGSLYIVLASTLLGLLISIPVVFYLNVYLKPNSKFAAVARLAYDILFGVPSIVYGAFGFTIMIWLGLRASLLGGIIVETLLVIPILIRTIDEVAKNIPARDDGVVLQSRCHPSRHHWHCRAADRSGNRHGDSARCRSKHR